MAEEADVDIEGDGAADCSQGKCEELSSGFVPDHYLDSVWKSNEDLTPWTLDSSISDENRAVIERMLLEEEYYLSNKSIPAKFFSDSNIAEKAAIKSLQHLMVQSSKIPGSNLQLCADWIHEEHTPNALYEPQKKTARLPIRSPSKPSSGAVKWTVEEKDLFEQGMAKFGRRWTNIARLIGSRTVLQVKSYARQYFKNKCKEENGEKEGKAPAGELPVFHAENCEEEANLSAFRGRADPNLNAVKIETLSDDEEVDITDEVGEEFVNSEDLPDTAINPEDTICQVKDEAIHPTAGQSHLTPERTHTDVPETEALCEKDPGDGDSLYCFSCVPHSDTLTSSQDEEVNEEDSTCLGAEDKDVDTAMVQASPPYEDEDAPEEDLKPPDQEVVLEPDFIQEEEKQAIPEFFEGRPAKTPERYLRIRNYILDQWKNSKPNYLNKTSVRPGLKNCGDVNCIGRVHTYLELIGAINFGCEQAFYNRPRPLDKTKTKLVKDTLEAYEFAHRLQTMRIRRRRVRDPWGNWCDSRDLEGQTFEHLSAEELSRRRERMKALRCSKGSRPPKSTFDPFQLIPCLDFTEERQAPFQVKISAEAMLILDLHSHVSMAEVIGLLGGRYSEEERVVEIWTAEPCNSLSTGLQCEMDPVSQTQASEALSLHGYNVIGWYHSHPAFDPNPSIRDIDTQAKYQSYFSRGGAKFLGMIISPYNRSNPLPQSQLSCLVIGDDMSEDGSYRIPYRFDVEHMTGQPSWEAIFEKTRWIVEKYRLSHSSVPMKKRFRQDSDLTCLQKLLTCLRRTLVSAACTAFADEFLSQIEDYFLASYTSVKDDVGGALAAVAEVETSTSDAAADD